MVAKSVVWYGSVWFRQRYLDEVAGVWRNGRSGFYDLACCIEDFHHEFICLLTGGRQHVGGFVGLGNLFAVKV
jgi:hypothetical protein